ncbi:MAG: DNA primase [Oscillospiraceae bacterium]|nr:DNA primase [Oscillospiraceae bacterium]
MKQSVDFQDFIDEVIEKNDIVDLISRYVTLKRVGNRFQALCPLHNDKKTPSFSVSPDKQLFHCFGCGAGGTVVHFIMQKENLDFMEAVKFLAERAGIPVPDYRSTAERNRAARLHDKKKRMYEMNAEAGRFFYSQLIDPKNGQALDYLRRRKLTDSTIRRFGLGYAPDSWSALIDFMKAKGYTEDELCEAGLAVKRDNGTAFDKFRDRVMFPILDLRGNVIAFGGRILTDKENAPKYLNSPETLVFKKKENLFAMNIAKNSKAGKFLLMEGYMDVISLHQNGFDNAVASLGTAFTPQQAEILKKYADKAVLCYDSDEAGQKATDRAGEILREARIKTKVLKVNEGKDPDEYINAKGAEMFGLLIDNAESFIEYKIHNIEKKYNLEDTVEKLEFIEEIAKVFANIKNSVEREIYVKEIARQTGISPDSIGAQVDNLIRRKAASDKTREQRQEKRDFEARTGGRSDLDKMRLYNAEKLLLNLMCEKEIFRGVKERLEPGDFTEGLHRRLAEIIFEIMNSGETVNPMAVISRFEEQDIGAVSEILSDDKNVDNKLDAARMPLKIVLDYKRKTEEKASAQGGDTAKLQEIMDRLKKDKK